MEGAARAAGATGERRISEGTRVGLRTGLSTREYLENLAAFLDKPQIGKTILHALGKYWATSAKNEQRTIF